MINKIKDMLSLESEQLSMYLEDVVINDINIVNKVIVDIVDYTSVINRALDILPNQNSSQVLEISVKNIKSLIENLVFERYIIGEDILVVDVLNETNPECSKAEYDVYLLICNMLNEYISMTSKKYIHDGEYLHIPLEWIDIGDRSSLRIIYVYVE